MAEIPARAVFTATTLWHFKVLASKQAAAFCSQTTLSRTACLKESRDCPGRATQKDGILKQRSFFFPATAETEKHAFSFSPTPFKCFVAGPLNELQSFAAKAESGSLS